MPEETNNFQDLYEVVKIVRFGLSPNLSKGKKDEIVFKTHQKLIQEVKTTYETLEKNKNKESRLNENELIIKIRKYIDDNKTQLNLWDHTCLRLDLISVDKDYYKTLSRKAKFDWSKNQSKYVKLTGLCDNKKNSILEYFNLIIKRNICLISNFEPLLKEFEDPAKSHKKPNLINFRKQFLSIVNVSGEWLNPIKNQSVIINTANLIDNHHNKKVLEFNSLDNIQSRFDLFNKGQEIREYFESNGSQTPFAKVTLNYYTARQKPENFGDKINQLILSLEIEKLYKKYENSNPKEIQQAILNQDNKENLFLGSSLDSTKIEIAQLFKPKPIPASVRFGLAERLSKNNKYDYQKLVSIFDEIGKSIDIGKEFNEWCKTNKSEDFNLGKYPLKLAFDYAWENLARWQIDNSKTKFAKTQSQALLNTYFEGINENREAFALYAKLLYIAENLTALEYQQPNNPETYATNIQTIFRDLNLDKSYLKHKESIQAWLNQPVSERAFKNNINRDFLNAKKKLGLLRGGLKNSIPKYRILTEKFKEIATDLGKNFAELRDKLREENQFTKITHYGVIVENSKDKYLLSLPLFEQLNTDQGEIDDRLDILKNKFIDEKTDFVVRQVSSFTSKTLNKILRNPGGYTEFHFTEAELKDGKNYEELKKLYPKKTSLLNKFKKNCHLKDTENMVRDYFLRNKVIDHIKSCLLSSPMAKDQNWQKFNWDHDLNKCETYEQIEKVLDLKGYELEEKYVLESSIKKLVDTNNCLLFPIINQDIQNKANGIKSRFETNQNQFTTDFEKALKEEDSYRIHPEVSLFYKFPTIKPESDETLEDLRKKHHAQILNRNSRFQIIGNFGIEIKANGLKFGNKKEQLNLWNSEDSLKRYIDLFNKKINEKFKTLDDYYIFGVDRGIKQLATLCITNKNGEIQENKIYKREFDHDKKIWVHRYLETRACLDLSNLRVETTIEGEKVLVDLAEIKVKNSNGDLNKENEQKTKLKKAAYIRKMQYLMSSDRNNLLNYIKNNRDLENLETDINDKQLFIPFKEGVNFTDLPLEKLKELLEKFYKLNDESESKKLTELEKSLLKQETEELDPTDDLKRGIVGNIIGVINYLMEKYDYKVLIALENLNRSFYSQKDGLTEEKLDKQMSYKEMENRILCGVGTYQFFETQLLRKLSKIQQEKNVLSLVPTFRSKENYEFVTRYKKPLVYRNFGIIYFVEPNNTSKKCPICGETKNISRSKNITTCNNCGFVTGKDNSEIINKYNKSLTLNSIKNSDENGAYNIGEKLHRISLPTT